MKSGIHLCRLDELADGYSRGFDPLQQGCDSIFIVRLGDRLHAWRNSCPHLPGTPMAWRKDHHLNVRRDRIVCYAHGALFDIVTGICVVGPCEGQSLTPASVRIDGVQVVQQIP